MKIGRVVGIGILTFTLTGCQAVADFKEGFENGYKQGVAEANVEVNPVSKEEYEVEVLDKTKAFYEKLGQTLKDLQEAKTIDQEMLDALYEEIDSMELMTRELVALEPPEVYDDADQVYEEAMMEFQVYLGIMREALSKEDLTHINTGAENVEKGELLLSRANALLSLTYAYPVGDGTITTQDLKDLDKNAGINRDSVLLNVSEDGNELVGKWGTYQEDGTFQMGIQLYEDGNYEGYANGESTPSIEGIWSYDYLRQTLSFEHGEGLRTMTMDIQAFHDDTLQLLDVDTLNTFYYVKEGTANPDSASTEEANTAKDSSEKVPAELKELWSVVTDQDVYYGLSLQEEEFASYSINDYTAGTTLTYMGSWKHDAEKNTITLMVEDALEDYKEVKDFPKTLTFQIVDLQGDTLTVEIEKEVLELKNH
ncbi:DUF3994 domain-containing protein [Sutcliffiella horikoshii]|uniref:DUF3994 domain-containing protein n=1 Tax=Sutcliffiella horikoshii TaxID=79883 RepID=UPI0038505E76